MNVTIVVTTKNRRDELAKCIDSCVSLRGVHELLIFDDGSTDNTYEFVKETYPNVSLHRSEISLGLIAARTKCATLAKGDIIVSIDDDCLFSDSNTISEIVKYFANEKIAVVTIPIIDVLISNNISQEGKGSLEDIYICPEYRGGANALRKEVFLELGGYLNNLVRQEEEKEFSTRLYSEGYIVRLGNCSKPILHYHSSVRDNSQISFYRARNKFIINYIYTPTSVLYFELFKQIFSLTVYELKRGNIKFCILGFVDALKMIKSGQINRNELTFEKYLFFKKIRHKKVVKLDDSIVNTII